MVYELCGIVYNEDNKIEGYQLKTPSGQITRVTKAVFEESVNRGYVPGLKFDNGKLVSISGTSVESVPKLNSNMDEFNEKLKRANSTYLKAKLLGLAEFEYSVLYGDLLAITDVYNKESTGTFYVPDYIDMVQPGALKETRFSRVVVKNRPNTPFYACGMFYFAKSKKLKIEFDHPECIVDMSSMFYMCSDLVDLDLSGIKTNQVMNTSYMFYNCSELSKIDLSGVYTSNVTNMQSMFKGCWNLAELDILHFSTGNVTSMTAMFEDCLSLRKLNLSGFSGHKVQDMDKMFYNCGDLEHIDLSGFLAEYPKMHCVKMFRGCDNLETLLCKDPRVTAEFNRR